MRFACQSCGKAYNLPEEKIADKSNVKLKCRVCGAIVEVKRQGDVVAQMLGETDVKRSRVSEAPAPLTSMSPDDSDDATHAIAVGDQILSESGSDDDAAAAALLGHVRSALGQRALAPLPPQSPTGFGSSPAGFGPTPVPPPLSMPDLPRPDLPRPDLARSEPVSPFARSEPQQAPPLPSNLFGSNQGSPPPPLPSMGGSDPGLHMPAYQQNGSLQHASNGMAPRFGEGMPLPDEPLPALPMASMSSSGMSAMTTGAMSVSPSGTFEAVGFAGASALEVQHAPASSDTTRKMLAALATGILIGFIIARLFF